MSRETTTSEWNKLKTYINSRNKDKVIYRKKLTKIMKNTSIDFYIGSLISIDVLERKKPGVYRIKEHIPEEMNTSILQEIRLRYTPWQQWFMSIHDKIKYLYPLK